MKEMDDQIVHDNKEARGKVKALLSAAAEPRSANSSHRQNASFLVGGSDRE